MAATRESFRDGTLDGGKIGVEIAVLAGALVNGDEDLPLDGLRGGRRQEQTKGS